MIREPCGWFLTRTDLFSLFAGGSTTISLPERLSSPCMYKSLKLQPCSVQQQLPYPVLVLSSEDRCLTLYFLFFFCYLFSFTWPVRVLLSFHIPHSNLFSVKMIPKSLVALLILSLTTSVNAAAIGPARQFLLDLIIREGHLLTSDLLI